MTDSAPINEFEACAKLCMSMDAPLADRLKLYADKVKSLAPEYNEIVERMVSRLTSAGAGVSAPDVGDRMPLFVLPDENGRMTSLARLLMQGKVVLAFHRGHWCTYCRINANTLSKAEVAVKAAGAQLVLITPETREFNRQLKCDSGGSFPILSDLDCGYALQLNLAIKIMDELRDAMTADGVGISRFQNSDSWILPIPATFVVGVSGLIKARFVDPDYRKRMEIEDLLSAIKA